MCVCINCACTFLCGCVCACACACVKRYEREVWNTCITKKENGRNCVIGEISRRHFKCNDNVSERRKQGMKPNKI